MSKEHYEISIWEDFIVPKSGEIPEHYDERKIAIIGSDSMTAQCRAIEPKLVENVNGTNTFTFKMYYTYVDIETGEKTQNPFISLLVNERKVKTFWKGKWYDLIIKNIQEDSNGKSITYTCKDLYVNELSKTGFNLEFNNELENNMGTAEELTTKVLEGTDWQVKKESDEILEEKEEPVYEVKLTNSIEVTDYIDKTTKVTIETGKTILLFYNQVQEIVSSETESGTTNFQIVYEESFKTEKNNQLVYDAARYLMSAGWNKKGNTITLTNIGEIKLGEGVSENYRAKRLIESYKTIFDSKLDRLVNIYKDNEEKEVYGYYSSNFNDNPTIVGNIFVNSKDFVNTEGWAGEELSFDFWPQFDAKFDSKSYLILKSGETYTNSGLKDSLFVKEGLKAGTQYVFRYRVKDLDESNPALLNIVINDSNKNNIFSINGDTTINNEWIERSLICNTSIPRADLLLGDTKIEVSPVDTDVWIEEIQLFEYIKNSNNGRINPGDFDINVGALATYKYYDPESIYTNEDDLVYLYNAATPSANYTPVSNGFTKTRAITADNSNRFNILQSIAETFECWIQFEIEHDPNGRITLDKGIPQKWVSIKKEIGQKTGIGFIYGIDLKTISRSIVSDQITTKVIVVPNKNEYAENGMCNIARSIENYPKTEFILDFGYYISQGLLQSGQINKDLYSSVDSDIGYYYWLNKYNNEYLLIEKELLANLTLFDKQKALQIVFNEQKSAAEELLTSLKNDFRVTMMCANDGDALVKYQENIDNNNSNPDKAVELYHQIITTNNNLNNYEAQLEKLNPAIESLKTKIEDQKERQEELKNQIQEKEKQFNSKYSRFIQEGSWTSEDYIDPNKYYLDALSVAYTSSRPQISYNISVLRLSALDEYKNKVFKIGDISYIQDTEFFGYEYINQIKTPYKEKVLISEITSWFDSPEKDSFKIQNYKTQFEDLFQRITASAQSLQFKQGGYQKAANSFTEDGQIKFETLQSSIALNEKLVFSSQNDSIVQDSTGITLIDLDNSSKRTKISSAGVFISQDGGVTWRNAIHGEGIATNTLTSGIINTNKIVIQDGDFYNFKWDAKGINAYESELDEKGNITEVNIGKYVRFDRFGIYGVADGNNLDFIPKSEKEVWDKANFALTWKGFLLKNSYGDGYVSINSDDDFVVFDGEHNRIKIGKIGEDENSKAIFGMQLRNDTGAITMETDDGGNLWLKNRLNVETYLSNSSVEIGKLDTNETKDITHGGRVIDANNDFMVYEDGHVIANSGSFKGHIEASSGKFEGEIIATAGKIGNMTIGEVEEATYKVVITSDSGTTFKGWNQSKTLTAKFYKGNTEITEGITYHWYKDDTPLKEYNSTLQVQNTEGDPLDVYSCEIEYKTENIEE